MKKLRADNNWGMLATILSRITFLAISKNLKIKMHRTIIFTCYFLWTWNLVFQTKGGT
jgi:hypothetical protein